MADLLFNIRKYHPQQMGRVAVVMGGWSAEREVSLMSGQQVFHSLSTAGVDAHAVDAGRDIANVLAEGGFDRAFLILHGRGGEDGTLQGALELAGVPYTGSGVLSSALCMDKWRAKCLVSLSDVKTPMAKCVLTLEDAKLAADHIHYPIVVKPTLEGSSIGVSMVDAPSQLEAAFHEARRYGPVMIEQRLHGVEIAATVIGSTVLPLVSMTPSGSFYDYQAKYFSNDTVYQCPVDLPTSTTELINAMALSAFSALGCRTWARIDFMLDDEGVPHFIECNTAPGMTEHSLVPIAARQAGVEFDEVCLQILSDTLLYEGVAA